MPSSSSCAGARHRVLRAGPHHSLVNGVPRLNERYDLWPGAKQIIADLENPNFGRGKE